MSSGPEALNGLISKSCFATPAELTVIECMAGMLCSWTVDKYEVSSVVKTEEKCLFKTLALSRLSVYTRPSQWSDPTPMLSFLLLLM